MVARQPYKILIVDDDPGITETCGKLSRRQGLIPIMATSGKEALAYVESEPSIEIVLTDLIMPDLSGVELLQAVKSRDPRAEADSITTGYGTIANAVENRRELGAPDDIPPSHSIKRSSWP